LVTVQLIDDCKKGKSKSLKKLYEAYAETMFKICLRYLKNTEDAEDILSQGFTKVFSNLSLFEYRDEKALRAWIKKIIVFECLMYLRKQHNFLMVSDEEAETIIYQDHHLSSLNNQYIFDEIAALPIGYRTVFNLYCIEGYKHFEIAEMLGIKEATSRSQLNKAKNILKDKLTKIQEKDERRRI
jgi:RNA polymerase sigma-70 factor (ECF subfamily)